MGGHEEQKGGNKYSKPIYFMVICDENKYGGFIMIGHPVER